jgi:glycosyltransferase involved in cell wall biosynthesis
MSKKLRVLMCSEASFLNSGFGTYAKEILSRLHATGKYKIAEFASYGFVNDPRDKDIPWRYYANAVRDDDPRHQEYSSRPDNQFGRWRFEKTLLDFRPDVVIDVRDYWMSSYQAISPLRNFFHWILMPTVDSEPQQEEWIDTFMSADAIFTYSDWGADVLKKQSNNNINYIDTVSPGVNLDIFNINNNKNSIKESLGLPADSIVIGSVMRNQKRKLIPELLYSFRKLLDILEKENNELGKNIFLYLHTSYPDAGWDIPELLKQTRLSNRVVFTYYCAKCGKTKASTFSHPCKPCPSCGENIFRFPSVTNGLSQQRLAEIYNCFDLYVQYSICEGFGMPQVEAAACGVPVITVNYSAMCDIVNKLHAYAVEPAARFKELETKAIRVYPDNNQLVQYIIDYINMPSSIQNKKRSDIRELTEQYYNWDHIAQKWEKYLDQLDSSGYRSDWNKDINFMNPIEQNIPKNKKDYFGSTINICVNNIKDIEKISSMMILNMSKDADYGFTQSGTSFQSFTYKDLLNNLSSLVNNNNQAETVRSQGIKFDDDFIKYAHMKDNGDDE